jgi:hypothetical protein
MALRSSAGNLQDIPFAAVNAILRWSERHVPEILKARAAAAELELASADREFGADWREDSSCMSNVLSVPVRGVEQTKLTALPSATPAFSYAFQPIVDTVAHEVFSYEALIRGPANEPAFRVLEQVPGDLKHQFDQDTRIQAIVLAARIGLKCHLNLNFLPRSLELCANAIGNTCKAAADNSLVKQ